ncbi:S1 family peptidase [Streptomyces albireticuli]|nr:S1 family peptidase [Streptomyces albireticuli]MCD9143521.1 S1 family peptidase [Streptomyces albireticuli]MCD9164880.1 S1 family peptidase [Streptomyces albireticuli]MCD9191638.1 S1 family peptidase [Streptomyces albireticuli]
MKRSWMPVRALLAAVAVAAFAAVTLSPQDADASTAGEPGAMTFSRSELASAQAALDAGELIPGTTWGVDPRVGRVVVTADPTVRGAGLARLKRAAASHGGKVVLRRSAAKLTRFLAGGDAVEGARVRCSLGFNVTRPGKPDGFLTAGHCGNAVTTWSAADGGPRIARTESGPVFPGHDYALAAYTDPAVAHPGVVDLHDGTTQPVATAREAVVGETVRRSGSTTGVRSGVVKRTGVTVTYPEGRVTGLTETTACAEPGDSGGPFFSHGDALGLLSGGSGDCAAGGTTYFQPVVAALAAYGAALGGS